MRTILFAAGALMLWAGAAQAQDRNACGAGMVCASDPASVARAMQKAGFAVKQTKDEGGDPAIASEAEGFQFDVFFYGCEKNRNCDSLRFQVVFQAGPENTAALANKLNTSQRFIQASVRKDGTLALVHDVGTIGGLNQRNFADVLDWWKSELGEAGDFFRAEFKPAPGDPKAK